MTLLHMLGSIPNDTTNNHTTTNDTITIYVVTYQWNRSYGDIETRVFTSIFEAQIHALDLLQSHDQYDADDLSRWDCSSWLSTGDEAYIQFETVQIGGAQ